MFRPHAKIFATKRTNVLYKRKRLHIVPLFTNVPALISNWNQQLCTGPRDHSGWHTQPAYRLCAISHSDAAIHSSVANNKNCRLQTSQMPSGQETTYRLQWYSNNDFFRWFQAFGMSPSRTAYRYERFGGTCCFHLQGNYHSWIIPKMEAAGIANMEMPAVYIPLYTISYI